MIRRPPSGRAPWRGAALAGVATAVLVWLAAAWAMSAPASAASRGGTSTAGGTGTVWLCHPGTLPDPCAYPPTATAVLADGTRTAAGFTSASPAASSAFDCFYVYPTVSTQKTPNSNLEVTKAEVAAALDEASPFSQVCSVWAPMYRQATSVSIARGLSGDTPVLRATFAVAYASLLSGWRSFLADSGGRPFVLVGHSQGAAILIHLIAKQIDPDPAIRRRLLVAILAGGNLQVPTGKAVGATFRHVPLCAGHITTGCAIAFSTFPSRPPADALFGRPGQGVSLQSGQTARAGQQVACVNPAALPGGTALLSPYFLTVTQSSLSPVPGSNWVTYPDLYAASCESGGGATWLQVTDLARPGDTRPVVQEQLGPAWGYHADDVNLTLGNLVGDVAQAEGAWARVPRASTAG